MIDQKHTDLMQQAIDLINLESLPQDAMEQFDAIYNKASEFTKGCLDDLRTTLSIEMDEQGLTAETPENKAGEIAAAAASAATSIDNQLPEPSQAQKEAGNYKKGTFNLNGLKIVIENPKDSTRSGKSANGEEWTNVLPCHYGDIAKTAGADGDKVDCFVGGDVMSDRVFIIDQVEPETREFDEHKVMLCFDNEDSARMNYLAAYDDGWQGIGAITEVTFDQLKEWLKGDTSSPYSSDIK
ncbi:hypothetical protein [Vibrio europaeus]|uniref:hypothetical protein n=1 Tax=Vibrio europaeus TaxID=300876 RepID=UPI00233F634D|nr:hypothetical protein [Vibrio europaeus]MDC5753533.1 hypothetical protein [Vibrio europaeus]MDC5816554.1 hypothetical protein [Vibrio europaeus]